MLAIRMQRTGRKGYASFRVIVQDSRFSPTSGRIVARLGHHNPHTKETVIDAQRAEQYLSQGAQPSPRVVKLFKLQKIALPAWVKEPSIDGKRSVKNPDKLRKNRPAEETAPEPAAAEETEAAPADEKSADEAAKTAEAGAPSAETEAAPAA